MPPEERERKPIKKCHQAPLSLSQGLQLGSPATKMRSGGEGGGGEGGYSPPCDALTHTHPDTSRAPQTRLSPPEEANEPNPLSSNEEG